MRENNRNTIEIEKMLPQFTTMNVIDGQAGIVNYSSLIFYSLTIDNILNIIVLLILAGITINAITSDNGIIQNALNAKVGDNVQLRISNKDEYDAQIVQINEGSGSRTIIFKIDKLTQGLITHRKVEVDVIWWNKSGLKVPIEALIEENGLYYVIRNRMGNQAKILVKVEYKTDNFAIIGSYSAEELQELGYDEKEIRNYRKISNYDEIVIESKK